MRQRQPGPSRRRRPPYEYLPPGRYRAAVIGHTGTHARLEIEAGRYDGARVEVFAPTLPPMSTGRTWVLVNIRWSARIIKPAYMPRDGEES